MKSKVSEIEKKRKNCHHQFTDLRTFGDSVCLNCQILFSEDWDSPFKVKDKVIVFDADDWMCVGDIGDNKQFYKSAVIEKVTRSKYEPHEWLADVLFDYGRKSNAHYQSAIKYL